MGEPIPGLRGTATHELAVVVYQRHPDEGSRLCGRCGDRAPCGPRRHAAMVIGAAGEDPRWYDDRWPAAVPQELAGYHLGGRGRPIDPEGSLYSR